MKELIVESNQSATQNVTSHLSNVLKQHKRTGTGEKSFTCSACDKTFVERDHSADQNVTSHSLCQMF